MANRLMQIVIPDQAIKIMEDLLEGQEVLGQWSETPPGEKNIFHLLVPAEQAESIMDTIENTFSRFPDFQLILLAVEAALPRPSKDKKKQDASIENKKEKPTSRISREELYNDVVEGIGGSNVFLTMAILSSIVASIGLLENDTAVLVGAMVIAPLLGPNVALALATTLGDFELAKNALKTSFLGIGLIFIFSVALGYLLPIDVTIPAIVSRTQVGYSDIALALAAGSAGTFAFTTGASGAVIGVMVAVALVPPLVTFGMLIGSENIHLAAGALLLTATNLICINLAGVATFLSMGVEPRSWWEAERAKKATRRAIAIWVLLLATLLFILYFSQR